MVPYINLGLYFDFSFNYEWGRQSIHMFLQDGVFSDWSSLKTHSGSPAGSSGFSHSWPALSLYQSLQVLTWCLLNTDTCPLGAHPKPCRSHCKDASWLPCRLTNPHTRRDQPAWSPPLQLMPRLGTIWTSHPLNTQLSCSGTLNSGILILYLSCFCYTINLRSTKEVEWLIAVAALRVTS